MTVIVIAQVTIAEGEAAALGQYLEVATPLLEEAGGKILHRFTLNEVVVGHRPARILIVVSYPSREAVNFVFSSDIYRELIPIRDQAFESYNVSIADHDSPAPQEQKEIWPAQQREEVDQDERI